MTVVLLVDNDSWLIELRLPTPVHTIRRAFRNRERGGGSFEAMFATMLANAPKKAGNHLSQASITFA